MNLRIAYLTLMLIALPFLAPNAKAQDQTRERVFAEGEKLMNDAIANAASLYAPRTFQEGLKKYNRAAEDYGKGKDLTDVEAELKESTQYFMKSIDISRIGKDVLNSVMKARSDAIAVEADKTASELLQKAESQLKDATNDLEESNLEDAKKNAAKSEVLFRSAEYDAIKVKLLAPAWEALKKAEDLGIKDIVPKTTAKAHMLVADAEEVLKHDRYDTSKAPMLALAARREGEHAIALYHSIVQIQHGDGSLEDALVAIEEQFERVSNALGLQPHFENGFESAAADAVRDIKRREATAVGTTELLHQATESIKAKDEEIVTLKHRAEDDERRIDSLRAEGRILRAAEDERVRDESVRSVSAKFTKDEAAVLREGDSIIIRLRGLSFLGGKGTIEPKYGPFLARVAEAVKDFQGGSLLVEGYTDASADTSSNQALSEQRAKSVSEMLASDLGPEVRIPYRGFSGRRSLEHDAAVDGNSHMTRIDVVVNPGWGSIRK